jgi:hypothetical protein
MSNKKFMENSHRIFGEDEASSGSDSGLDIIKTSRKGLDLSQYIDGHSSTSSFSGLYADKRKSSRLKVKANPTVVAPNNEHRLKSAIVTTNASSQIGFLLKPSDLKAMQGIKVVKGRSSTTPQLKTS